MAQLGGKGAEGKGSWASRACPVVWAVVPLATGHTSSGHSGLGATRSKSLQRNTEQGSDNQEWLGHAASKDAIFVALNNSPPDPCGQVIVHWFWHEGRTKCVASLQSSSSNEGPASGPTIPQLCTCLLQSPLSLITPANASGIATMPGEPQAPESSPTQSQSLCPGTEHQEPGSGLQRHPLAPPGEL